MGAVAGEQFGVGEAGVLAAAIRMHDQAGGGLAQRDRHLQRRADQRCRHGRGHRPAADPARVQVHDRGQIQPGAPGADAGDVARPGPIGRRRRELAIEPILGHRQLVTAVGGMHKLASPRGLEAKLTHQPAHPVAPDRHALSMQRRAQTPAAVAPMPLS